MRSVRLEGDDHKEKEVFPVWKLLGGFLIDQLLFSIIYTLSLTVIIGFYQMTTSEIEYAYPILIAVFFYVIYMVIRLVQYFYHAHNLMRLEKNAVAVSSSMIEHRLAYRTIHRVYKHFGNETSRMREEQQENKRLISSFIHNIKTPVTVSSLLIQRCNNDEITSDQALKGIDQELSRVSENLNQLLELQRMTELEKDYEPKAANLAEEVRKVVNQNKRLFISSHVYPKVEIGETIILTDPKWNSVVLQQLISNAVKYSRCEENKYVFFQAEQNGKYTDLIIQDQGIGIPEYDLPKVFDAYFTGSNGRDGYNSSGIGLYLCRQICDRLGAKIRIENHDGCRVIISYLSKL